jgi:hypothetical protein
LEGKIRAPWSVLVLAERAPSEGWEGNSQTILLAR